METTEPAFHLPDGETIALDGRRQPMPEDVLLSWIIRLPDGVDPAGAARKELARPQFRDPTDPRILRLRQLFREVAGTGCA